jgi:hypothetical protein
MARASSNCSEKDTILVVETFVSVGVTAVFRHVRYAY